MGDWYTAGLSSVPRGGRGTILVGSNEKDCSDIHDLHTTETGGNVKVRSIKGKDV
jgi:hypothetical protein